MKHNVKRILSALLVLCMVLSVLPTSVFAAGTSADLQALIDAAAVGGTVTLTQDYDCDAQIAVGKDLTLDMGSYTISTDSVKNLIQVSNGATLTLKGTDAKIINTKNGSGRQHAIRLGSQYVTDGSSSAKLVVDSGVTISAEVGVGAYGASSSVKTAGTIKGTTEGIRTDRQSYPATAGTTTIEVTGGAVEATNGIAVAFTQPGTLTISGGTIKGSTAVYAQSVGSVNISGGTLEATGAKQAHNGTDLTPTGDALVLDNYGKGSAAAAFITGGTFKSANADAIANYAWYASDPVARGFLAGGRFNTALAEEFLALGYRYVDYGDGTYGVEKEGYAVSFYADESLVDQIHAVYGDKIDVPAVPAKAGYDGAWIGIASGLTQIDVTGNASYTAQYTAKNYTWKTEDYDLAAGTGATGTVAFGGTFTPPYHYDAPEGQIFQGWYGSDGRVYLAGSTVKYTTADDLVLSPIYVDMNTTYWTVKFVTDGEIYDVQIIEQGAGKTITLPAVNPTKEGYAFGGWYAEYAGEIAEDPAQNGDMIETDMVYSAKWTKKTYSVTVDTSVQGITVSAQPKTAHAGDVVTIQVTRNTGTKMAYLYVKTVVGARPVALTKVADDTWQFVMPAADVLVYGSGEPVMNEVHFVVDGRLYAFYKVLSGYAPTPPEVKPTKAGYTFIGWRTAGGTVYADGQTLEPIYTDITYTAQWAPNTHTITTANSAHVSVAAPASAGYGAVITATVTAETGYELYYVKATTASGKPVPMSQTGTNTYQFVMPDENVTVTVTEQAVDHLVKFMVEGSVYAFSYVPTGTAPVAPAAPVKEGYTFIGWKTAGGVVYADGQIFAAIYTDETYTAQWAVNTYTVTTVNSDHAELTAPATAGFGTVVTVTVAAETGYELYYIKAATASGKPVAVSQTAANTYTFVMPAENVTVTATEQANDNLVKFMVEDGVYAFSYVPSGTAPVAPAAPSKDGYTFAGWKAESDGTLYTAEDAFDVIYADETYTAQWTENTYTITKVESDHASIAAPASAGFGTVITVSVTPTAGYETYYINTVGASGRPVAMSQTAANTYVFTMPDENVTVTVTDQPIHNTVQFIVDGEIYAFSFVPSGTAPVAPAVEPVKEGYTFTGWKAESDGAIYAPEENFDAIYADETYTAQWVINEYSLTYYRGAEADASEYKCFLTLADGTVVEFFNNDTLNMPTYVVEPLHYGDKIQLGEPSLPGYNFLYWLDESGYQHPAGANFTMPAEDVLLTAVWEVAEENCMILFMNGGAVYDIDMAAVGTTAYVPETDPSESGRIFKGWKIGEGADAQVYSNDGVSFFTVEPDENKEMVFTAVWEDELYSIHYTGDAVSIDPVTDILYGTTVVLADAPEREGFTFIAWEDTVSGAYYYAKAPVEVKNSMTLAAVWQEDKVEYVVKFFDEKGNLVDVFVVEKNGTIIAPAYEQGRDDATYLWIDAENNRIYRPAGTIEVDRNLNFRAVLESEAEYNVAVFVTPDNADTANATVITKNTYKLGTNVCVDITVPEGYLLKSVDAFGASVSAVKSTLLHADENEYKFLFEMPAEDVAVMVEFEKIPAGKSAVKFMVDGEMFDYVIVTKGENGTAPEAVPTKAGWEFQYWQCGTTIVEAGEPFAVAADAEDVIVYEAVFTQNTYAVNYDAAGGVPQPTTVSAVYGEQITLASAPKKDGFVFIGWVEASTGFIYSAGATYTVRGDATFTAKWEAAECVVRFVDPTTGIIYGYEPIHQGDTVVAPAAPVVSGKTFIEWVNAADASDSVKANGTTRQLYTDTVYHATYKVSEYNIAVVTENCTVTGIPTGTVAVGTEVSFKVQAAENYAVDSVILTYTDGLSPVLRELFADETGTYSFVMPNANVTVTAVAKQNVFSIFTTPDAQSQINVLNGNKAATGDTVVFTVNVTDPNYELLNVLVTTQADGSPIPVSVKYFGAVAQYIFTMPATDVVIETLTIQAEYTVTYLDSDNTILEIVPVKSGELATAPVPTRDGYVFAGWEILPGLAAFDPATDVVTKNLIVRAVYVGEEQTVAAGKIENVAYLQAECTVSSGNLNSSNLLLTEKLLAETGKTVYFTVAAEYDWLITDIAVVSAEGTNLVVSPTLREIETIDNLVYYTYAFEMPAENVLIDVYTAPKPFKVSVTENIPAGGEYTINGYYTNNLMVLQGRDVAIDVTPNAGYEIVSVTGTYIDNLGNVAELGGTWDGSAYTFTMIAKDVEISIVYKAIDYVVDLETSNFLTYKPDASQNPAKVVESLDDEFTSQGIIRFVSGADRDYTNALEQVYKIPSNGTANVGDRIAFTVEEFTGYDLASLTVTYDNGEQTCPLTFKDGTYYFDMPAYDVVITATFVEETYTVTKDAASETHGKVTMNGLVENVISADYKDEVTVTVTPDDGYQITKIYYTLADGSVKDFDAASYTAASTITDALDTAHSITFHMPATDVTVFVEYAAIDYSIHEVLEEATATYDEPRNVGEQVVFETKVNYGYIIEKVYVVNDTTGERVEHHTDSTNQLYGASYTFTMPASSVTIHVETIKDEYNVKYLDNGALIAVENVAYLDTADVASHVMDVVNGKAGYHFVGWTSADVQTPVTTPSVDNDDFVIVKDTIIRAAYERDEIDVFFTATENGTVTELSTGNTAEYRLTTTVFGDKVKFTAVPDEGYVIDTVSVTTTDGEGYNLDIRYTFSGGEYSFMIPASYKADIHTVQAEDVVVTVTFKKDTFTLTRANDCETNGVIAVNGKVATETTYSYLYQDAVSITATPNNGYYVASITAVCVDGTHSYTVTGTKPAADTAAGDALTLAFNMPACDLTYKVDYEKIDYTITTVFNAEWGDVVTAPANLAQLDDIVTVTVTPKLGYKLGSITVTYEDGKKSCVLTEIQKHVYTFTMPAAGVTVTVVFVKDAYTLTRADDCETDGVIAVNGEVATETSYTYLYQDAVAITAAPKEGYYVASISATCADGEHTYTVTGDKPAADTAAGPVLTLAFEMPACDLTYTVDYEKIDYTITTVFNAEQGTVVTDPADKAQIDDIVTVTVTPKTGYRLVSLTVTYANGEKSCVLTEIEKNVYTFTMPAAAVTVTAIFDEVAYTASLEVEGDAYVSLNGFHADSIQEQYLSTVTVDVTPAAGWELVSIAVDGGNVSLNEEIKPAGGSYTFTMPNHDVKIEVKLVKTGFDMTAYALNFFESGHGTVTLDPKTTAYVGDRIIITADPDDGYRVREVVVVDEYGNAVPVSYISGTAGYVETWSFTMPACDVKIVVYFTLYGSSYYTDVRTDHWFFEAVTFVTDRGYFFGMSEDLFAPNLEMDRAMFVTVLGRLNGVDVSEYTDTAFEDVKTGSYYAPYVAWAEKNGIVFGRDEKTFDPHANITREEMAAIMYRYCKFIGMDMTIQNSQFMDRYQDADDISAWAKESVEWAVGIGLMLGMSENTIDPQGLATRAQVAQVVKNLCDKVIYE